jgi:putative transposase
LSTVGARSVLKRYSDAWFQAAKRHQAGQRDAGFPRRKRALVPVRCYHGTFTIQGQRVRLPVAKGHPALWVRLARPLPYPPEQVRAVTLLADGGGCGWRSPPPSPSSGMTWIGGRWRW